MDIIPRWQRILIVIILFLVFVAAAEYKHYLLLRDNAYNLPDSAGAFWSEAAFHFRHARMVKDGIGIPSRDIQIQYPEGIEVWKNCTPIMDLFFGNLYRAGLTMGLPFHRFVLRAQSIWSALSIFAVFLGGMALWKNRWNALLAAVFFAFSLGHMDRYAIYLRENFALPLIWLHLALFLMAVRSESRQKNVWFSAGSAASLILAFASWHVTRFYFLLFIGALVLTQLPLRGISIMTSRYFHNIRRSLLVLTAANIAAALLLPMLRNTNFILAPSMMLSYGLLLCYYVVPLSARFKEKSYYLLSIIILVASFSLSYTLEKVFGFYSHVEELIKAKILFLGMLPEDPTRLSFEAKIMWNGPFMSPSPEAFMLIAMPGLILLGFVTVLMTRDWFHKESNRLALMILVISVSAVFWFILVERLHILMHVPVALLAACIGSIALRKSQLPGRLVIGGLICLQLYLLVSSKINVIQPNPNVLRSLASFIQKETPDDAVFACELNLGPSIACDANRAVLLQSKFENDNIRKKVEEVYTAMLEDEDKLLEVCKRYGATYFVLSIDSILNTTRESLRYWDSKTRITRDMVACRMHFFENQLQHFKLVFQNINYRVFKISDEAEAPLPAEQYWPIWDATLFGIDSIQSNSIPDDLLQKTLSTGTNVFGWIESAEKLKKQGRIEEAESLFIRSIYPALSIVEERLRSRTPDVSFLVEMTGYGAEEAASAFSRKGQNREAAQVIYRAARPFALTNNLNRAMQLLEKALMYDPQNQQVITARDQLAKKITAR